MLPDAIVMRLPLEQIQIIRQTVEGILGASIQISIFGSRLNDGARSIVFAADVSLGGA